MNALGLLLIPGCIGLLLFFGGIVLLVVALQARQNAKTRGLAAPSSGRLVASVVLIVLGLLAMIGGLVGFVLYFIPVST